MECLDLKGKTCPVPVIETKRLIESGPVELLQVIVDNSTSRENVTRFLVSRGYEVSVEEREGEFCLTAKRASGATAQKALDAKRIAVLIDGETMGRGSDQLGAVLMRSFLNTLKELDPLPWRLIFVNTGVRLTTEGSEYLSVLSEIADLGVDVVSCGTCLDFFQMKDKLRVGRVSNMYEIVSSLAEASHTLKP
ncbi:MAG TPA: sulfurtransferase-like selenium metabolism protein YedF [Deltaproteobacteria bacterium]|nr:sulfurtransferase-like selenium metabolism protein YedF [Deltaproteobacteria bacterium]